MSLVPETVKERARLWCPWSLRAGVFDGVGATRTAGVSSLPARLLLRAPVVRRLVEGGACLVLQPRPL